MHKLKHGFKIEERNGGKDLFNYFFFAIILQYSKHNKTLKITKNCNSNKIRD